jgi:hypothetical protein
LPQIRVCVLKEISTRAARGAGKDSAELFGRSTKLARFAGGEYDLCGSLRQVDIAQTFLVRLTLVAHHVADSLPS